MLSTQTLDVWMSAASEAVNDFSVQMLGIEELNYFSNLEQINEELFVSLAGSYIQLNCGDSLVEVAFLSSDDVLLKIGKLMHKVAPADQLFRDDMIDAIKEVVNIISGGIKSRLNGQIEGGILLGIPMFSDNLQTYKQAKESLSGVVHLDDMRIYLLLNRIEYSGHSERLPN